MEKLSDHFTLEELTWSDIGARRGVPNVPGPAEKANLVRLAAMLEKVRVLLMYNPVLVHSGYRSPEVNALVGGVPTSQHCKGLAADFVCPSYGGTAGVALAIKRSNIEFDQLILEYGWVHISIPAVEEKPRLQCLTKRSAQAPYEQGIQV